jgi:hypothetical protein
MDHQRVNAIDRMLLWAGAHRMQLWTTALMALMLPVSLCVMANFLLGSNLYGMGYLGSSAIMDGSANKPYVMRQLLPLIVRTILDLTPADALPGINAWLHSLFWNTRLFVSIINIRQDHPTPPELQDARLYTLAILMVLDYLFLLGYAGIMWLLARRLFPASESIRILAPLIALLAIPPFCTRYGFFYDMPVMFFAAWCMLLLLQRRMLLLTVATALATLNKETAIYLIALFALYGYHELPRRAWVIGLCEQMVCYVVIKLALVFYFGNNPDDSNMQAGLFMHMRLMLEGYGVDTLLGLAVALGLFAHRWDEKPSILKCWICLLPPMFLAFFLFGNRGEYRVFYDIFPALSLLAAHTLARVIAPPSRGRE